MNRLCFTFVPLALLLCDCAPDTGRAAQAVQYGTIDNRLEVYEVAPGPHRTVAETAVAMQLGASSLDVSNPAQVRVTYTRTLGTAHSLCPGVRYAAEIEPGLCSGTLIDDRHVLTAGHCVNGPTDCDGSSWPWLFGFYYTAVGTMRPLTRDDVYYCTRAVVLRNDLVSDYAVIALDRPVVGHTPARIRASATPPAVGTSVTLIGHPNGIPMKLAGGASVRAVLGADFVADVDAFSGNSGSGIFNDLGEVVGILVSGNPDWTRNGGCNIVNVIDPVGAGVGEDATGVQTAITAYCAAPGVVSPACDCTSTWCGTDSGVAVSDAAVDASSVDVNGDIARDVAGEAGSDARMYDSGSTGRTPGGCGCRATGAGGQTGGGLVFGAIVAGLLRRARLESARRKLGAGANA